MLGFTKHPHQVARLKGFTLIELMIVIAIMALVTVFGIPSLTAALYSQRISVSTTDLTTALSLARGEAIRRGIPARVSPLDGEWSSGWTVLVDANEDGDYSDDEDLIQTFYLQSSIKVSTLTGDTLTNGYIEFNSRGFLRDPGSVFSRRIQAINCKNSNYAKAVQVTPSGHATVKGAECG